MPELPEVVAEQVEIFAKYEGYINKQKQEVEKALKLENKKIPADIDYLSIKELSSEAAEKLGESEACFNRSGFTHFQAFLRLTSAC